MHLRLSILRLSISILLMLLFPVICSEYRNSLPSSPGIVYAGHSIPGGRWCACGDAGCICDPGEIPPGGQGLTIAGSDQNDIQAATSNTSTQPESLDLGSGLFAVLAVAITLWLKMRA